MPQSLAQILVHLIFGTKNREAMLSDDPTGIACIYGHDSEGNGFVCNSGQFSRRPCPRLVPSFKEISLM